jgi:phage-related protein
MFVWTGLQYKDVWDTYYESCDTDTQATIDRRFDYLMQNGNRCREPVSKHLDDGIFELRAKDARLLYYFSGSRTIIFVHALTKKRGEVPRPDIDLAKYRRNEIRMNQVSPNALPN